MSLQQIRYSEDCCTDIELTLDKSCQKLEKEQKFEPDYKAELDDKAEPDDKGQKET